MQSNWGSSSSTSDTYGNKKISGTVLFIKYRLMAIPVHFLGAGISPHSTLVLFLRKDGSGDSMKRDVDCSLEVS